MSTLEFLAGQVKYDESTHRATPLPAKGKITLKPAGDGMVSFLWSPRGKLPSTSSAETIYNTEELLLFPGDANWSFVKQCDTGRVLVLKFKSSGDRMMFWLQKPNKDDNEEEEKTLELNQLSKEDEAILAQLNEMLKEEEEQEKEEEEEVKTETTGDDVQMQDS